jgi:hypothetical protein
MTDVPTLTSATTANYCTINPIIPNLQTITDGNLKVAYAVGAGSALGSIAMTTGKWYWEVTSLTSATGQGGIGVFNSLANTTSWLGAGTNSWAYWNGGEKYTNASGTAYGASWGAGDVIGVAVDADVGSITFYKNNVSQGVAYTGLTGPFYPAHCAFSSGESMAVNFGQQGFKYTPPTGFVALNTFNLPTPTIGATASTQANRYMDISLYTGNASALTVSGLNFSPDLVWIKPRDLAYQHQWYDTVRGALKRIGSSSTAAENTETETLKTFTSNGFTLGNDVGTNPASPVVAWCWDAGGTGVTNTAGTRTSTVSANTSSGFSVVTYSGNSTRTITVGHGLGVAPSMIIIKNRTTADTNWTIYHSSLGANKYLNFNTSAEQTSTDTWNNTSPTSTVFSLGDTTSANGNGDNLVAYCFSEVAGYSKFGSYTGNGSSDGPFVYTGFRPRYVLIKNATNGSDGYWWIHDTAREPYNLADKYLVANGADAEGTSTAFSIDILSNGFKVRGSNNGVNGSGTTLIYAAFAESPFNYANAR